MYDPIVKRLPGRSGETARVIDHGRSNRTRSLLAVLATAVAAAAVAVLLTAAPSHAGQEIADLTDVGRDFMGPTDVLLANGSNPIGAEAFETYDPPPGYLKNTERTAEFNAQETLSSPGLPEPEVEYVTTPDDYTWIFIARTYSAVWPFRPGLYPAPPPRSAWAAAVASPTPPAGTVRYSSNAKNQLMTFWAREGDDEAGEPIQRYFVRDRWGNRYMMMASGAATEEGTEAAFEAAELPRGWTRSKGPLNETVTLHPAYDLDDNPHYAVWRDSADSSWVQVEWSRSGRSIAQKIGDGMPIWGSGGDDRARGTDGDDTIHGAEGDDRLLPRRGDDVVLGDAGRDVAVLPVKSRGYRVAAKSRDSVTLKGRAGIKELHAIERVRFRDGSCGIKLIRSNASAPRGSLCRR